MSSIDLHSHVIPPTIVAAIEREYVCELTALELLGED